MVLVLAGGVLWELVDSEVTEDGSLLHDSLFVPW